MEWRWDGGLQWWMDGLKRWINSVRADKKLFHNVGQRTSALCCHGSPLMARSFSNMDAFHHFKGVRDSDVFFLCVLLIDNVNLMFISVDEFVLTLL